MATLIDEFPCTITAGTLKSAPMTVAIPMVSRIVTGARVRIPRGPNGNLGFQIGAQGQQIIPENAGNFIVADDEIFDWDLTNFPQGGSYQLIGYNTGRYNHTVYVTLLADPVQASPAQAPTAIPAAVLSTVPITVDTGIPSAPTLTAGQPPGPVAPPELPPAPVEAPTAPSEAPPATLGGVTAPPTEQPPTIPTGPAF